MLSVFLTETSGINYIEYLFQSSNTLKLKTETLIDSSKLKISDSTKISKQKSVTPIRTKGLNENSMKGFTLSKSELNKFDYKYTGNFFSYFPFGFIRDLGSTGQPNEVLLYGHGFNNSTYLIDGINITNRLNNSLDLNLVQSESIDEIEVLPLVQGFFYGSNNNPATVNFIPADFKQDKPYTRIRFYQAANQEGFIDGIFNSNFSKRLGVFFEVTNHSIDSTYKNSNYSAWLVSSRIRYLLSNKISFIASYRYSKSTAHLYGGVNYDSIKSIYTGNEINEVLYDYRLAPVNYINRYQKVSLHDFSFKTLADIIPNSPSSITLYYQTNLTEFRQNDSSNRSSFQNGIEPIINNNKYKTIGAQFDQKVNAEFINVSAIAAYERNTFTSPLLWKELKQNIYSIAINTDIKLFDESIFPSVFGKYLNYDNIGYSGLGTDISFEISEELKLYAGYAEYQKPKNTFYFASTSEKQRNKSFELAFNYEHEYLKVRTSYFSQANYSMAFPIIINSVGTENEMIEYADFLGIKDITLKGINIKFDLTIWKILLSSNSSFYFFESDIKELGIPQLTSNGGIYYIDTLFNSNLKLKTGFNYWSIGNRYGLFNDFEKNISSPYIAYSFPQTSLLTPGIPNEKYSPSFQLDFFLAGQIQENAIVYFTWENLFNTQYFIVPYYPMPERSIRFGVAWEFLD